MKMIVGRAATAALAVAGGLLLVNGSAFASAPLAPAASAGAAGEGECGASSHASGIPDAVTGSHSHSIVNGDRPAGHPGPAHRAGECAKHIKPGPKCPPPCPPTTSTTKPVASTTTTKPPSSTTSTTVVVTTTTTKPPSSTTSTTKPTSSTTSSSTTVTSTPPTTPPSTGPTHVDRPPMPTGEQLPVTGSWTAVLAVAGVAVLALGGVLLAASRRRLDRPAR